jgi:hypothetical protein
VGDKGGKVLIEREFMQFELNLQNNYKDLAFEGYRKVHDMLDSFLEQGEISNWYYRHMKKKMIKYDEIYKTQE